MTYTLAELEDTNTRIRIRIRILTYPGLPCAHIPKQALTDDC